MSGEYVIQRGTGSRAHSFSRKSQIAIEYAYRVRELAPQTWVFWVYASNASRIKEAYKDIAAKLKLPGWKEPNIDTFDLVYKWLCDERNGRWLMILDNVDDDQIFSGPANSEDVAHRTEETPLLRYLPQSSNGWILVTSRNRRAALNLVGASQKGRRVLQVETMAEKEALLLLKNNVTMDEASEDDSKTLVKILEYIPLAITQASAYITVNQQTFSVSRYLQIYREGEKNQEFLLNSDKIAGDLRRDPRVSNAVIIAWQISFEQISKSNPAAADLLSLMSMFESKWIPERLVRDGRDFLQFEEALEPLINFSLIKVKNTKESEQRNGERLFDMHNLVQLATRTWLNTQKQFDRWVQESWRTMTTVLSVLEHSKTCQVLLPHAQKTLHYVAKDEKTILDRATVAYHIASCLRGEGENVEAERLCREVLEATRNFLGPVHPDTLATLTELSCILVNRGKYPEAQSFREEALEGWEKRRPDGCYEVFEG